MFQLTESDQHFLLQTARNSVRSYLAGETPRTSEPEPGVLREPRGIFVSIHKGGQLRGCIGNVHAGGPLYRSAGECAISAAVGDPRFMPLTTAELPFVEFEISVLSPIERVEHIDKIQIGVHGLLVSKGSSRGLLLPKVASTYGWNCEKFLQETCIKAGLKPNDWKDGATIQCFSALVFSERQFHLSATT